MNSIPKSTYSFLRQLEKNNNREWFAENKPIYIKEYEHVKAFFESVRIGLEAFDEIEDVRIHRIYRDIRFSKDKTPYKNHFSGGFRRAGKFRRGGCYLHLEPGNSFVAGGFWSPNKEDLLRLRKELDLDAKPLMKILNKASFKNHFGTLRGEGVKSAPRGFSKDHPNIDLIRKKQFYVVHHFKNSEVHDARFKEAIIKSYKLMLPYFDYMTEVLTTNLDGEVIA